MIKTQFYINQNRGLATELTDLALDEIETLVGRFAPHSQRAGQLRGKVVAYISGLVEIRTSFGNKLIWRKE